MTDPVYRIPTKAERRKQRLHDVGVGLLAGALITLTLVVLYIR